MLQLRKCILALLEVLPWLGFTVDFQGCHLFGVTAAKRSADGKLLHDALIAGVAAAGARRDPFTCERIRSKRGSVRLAIPSALIILVRASTAAEVDGGGGRRRWLSPPVSTSASAPPDDGVGWPRAARLADGGGLRMESSAVRPWWRERHISISIATDPPRGTQAGMNADNMASSPGHDLLAGDPQRGQLVRLKE